MRALSLIILALVGALLVAVGVLIFHPEQRWLRPPQIASEAAETSGSAIGPKLPSTGKPTGRRQADRGGNPFTAATAPPGPVGIVPTGVGSGFPRARDVVTGTDRSAILASFGPPTAIVTGADYGQLRERFVYLDKVSGTKTLVYLVNGNVIGADTYSE